jgi:hypothetical protein
MQFKSLKMKKTLLTSIMLLFFTALFGQKTEFKVQLNSGLFSFAGASAVSVSAINASNLPNFNYTNNPYGSKPGLCYGLSATITRVTKKEFLLGIDVGYEVLRSKVLIDRINGVSPASNFPVPATGQTYLNFNFLNLYPHIGQRFIIEKIAIDITGGFDFSRSFKAKEQGHATISDGTVFTTSRDRTTTNMDVRPRIQLAATYNRIGIYVGYAQGFLNYLSGSVGGTNDAHSRLIRFGLAYQIR